MKRGSGTAEKLAEELSLRLYFGSADMGLQDTADTLIPKVKALTRVAEAAKRVDEALRSGDPEPEDDDALDELHAALAAWRRNP